MLASACKSICLHMLLNKIIHKTFSIFIYTYIYIYIDRER